MLSLVELVETFVNDSDVKPLLSNFEIPNRIHWITEEEIQSSFGIGRKTQWIVEEMFKRMRKAISEVVPVLLVAG